MKLKVALNGTDTNPYMKMGFTQNPFPQVAKAELMHAMNQLNKLAAEPIPDTRYIRETLKGWSEEFVDLCVQKFKKGQYIEFTVEFPG